MVLIDSRPAGEAAKPLPASVATPECSTRILTPRVPLLFLVAELVSRRKVDAKLEVSVHAVGLLVLLALILVVTLDDIRR